jgi:hypothetical protein
MYIEQEGLPHPSSTSAEIYRDAYLISQASKQYYGIKIVILIVAFRTVTITVLLLMLEPYTFQHSLFNRAMPAIKINRAASLIPVFWLLCFMYKYKTSIFIT